MLRNLGHYPSAVIIDIHCIEQLRHLVFLEFYIYYRSYDLMYSPFVHLSTSYFCASEPATISMISSVIADCLALL